MTKTLRKAIMKRFNNFNQVRNAKNWSYYKEQRSHCSNLSKESKLCHFNNIKDQTENNRFWKTKFFSQIKLKTVVRLF